MPPKRARKTEEVVAKSIDDMDETELKTYIEEKAAEVAELTALLDAARAKLVDLQKNDDMLSLEDRFNAWANNGASKDTKTLSELRTSIIGDLLNNALSDGCVNRHETKTADCLMEIIYDYAGTEELGEADRKKLQYLMDNNIGEVIFE